jgi:aspartate aminotransferase
MTTPRDFATSVVSQMDRVGSRITDEAIKKLRARGEDVLKLSPYPIKPLPDQVRDIAERAVNDIIQPPSRGLLELREAICENLSNELSLQFGPDEVLVTNGGMHALSIAFRTLIDPGDEVAAFSPCYFYHGVVELMRGIVRRTHLAAADGYRFDFERLESEITERTKILLINTPANPTGYVATQSDIEQIARLAEKHDLFVLADEVYDTLIYDGRKHISLLSVPELKPRTAVIRSFTKSYALPEWRVGFIVAGAGVIDMMLKVLEWDVLNCGYLSQKVASAVLRYGGDWLRDAPSEFERNRNALVAGIDGIEELSMMKPQGTPFAFIDISDTGLPSREAVDLLVNRHGIPCTAGHYLFADSHVRVPFGGELQTIQEAVKRLKQGALDLREHGVRGGSK